MRYVGEKKRDFWKFKNAHFYQKGNYNMDELSKFCEEIEQKLFDEMMEYDDDYFMDEHEKTSEYLECKTLYEDNMWC